ncbi:uncharacterized protein, partial [Neodiprion pinetum]|uniref:uncharacterized protein n=1 Tax=Neodiprion pinetum TaxID=441929 RepID=UPI001EDF474F
PHNEERAQGQLIFLRNACPKTQKKEILLALEDTFNIRRSAPERIFEDFPRFLDTPYLINADFRLMHPNIKVTNFSADTGTPLDNAPIKTAQPCLLAVGPNKAAISSYFIAVEKKVLPIDATDSSAAFDTLFKCHFVFNTNFDTNLSMYYNFLQEFYYKMESNVRFTARMREVRAWLTQI